MLQYDFENSPGYWIFATAHALYRAMNEELQQHGITYRQWEVLAWTVACGEMSQSELAERMRIEAPTLVGVLDRMERDGWIERVPSEKDRRKKMIYPTPRVMPMWEKMVACAMRVRGRALRGVSNEQLTVLRDVLATMRRQLTEDRPDAAAPPPVSGEELTKLSDQP